MPEDERRRRRPGRHFRATVEQERNVAALYRCGHRLGAVDERALVGVGEAEQDGGDVGSGEDGVEFAGE